MSFVSNRRFRAAWVVFVGLAPFASGGACSGNEFASEKEAGTSGEAGEPGSGGRASGGASGDGSGGKNSSGGSGVSEGGDAGEGDRGGGSGAGGRGGSATGGDAGDPGSGGDAGNGGSGASGGMSGSSNAGSGGSNNAGSGGSNTAGSGGSNTGGSGGSNTTGGSGGSTNTGGSNSTGGSGGFGGLPPNCIVRVGEASTPIIYSGPAANNTCNPFIDAPRTGVWRSFGDGTAAATATGTLGGRGAAPDCGMHNAGTNFHDWGGGMGFGLNMSQSAFCRYDASAYSGVRVYLKGSATGSTNSPSGALANNWVRVTLGTVQTASMDEGGACTPSGTYVCNDHFAKFCQLGSDWTPCDLSLSGSGLSQWGFGAPVTFSRAYLLEITFEVHRATTAAAVSFDYSVDDITFF